jgi:hypothetical protein
MFKRRRTTFMWLKIMTSGRLPNAVINIRFPLKARDFWSS